MKLKRILSLWPAITMVFLLLPMSLVPVSAVETTEKNITLGAEALRGGQKSNVYFGNYYQTSNSEKDPIKWRVLDITDSEVFLLSDKNLDTMKYNETLVNVTWETSTIRSWLNSDFIDSAFNSMETDKIITTDVINDDNPYTDVSGGENTKDKIFFLSVAEALNQKYGFSQNSTDRDQNRVAANTPYAQDKIDTYEGWWLRSPAGYDGRFAASVSEIGTVICEKNASYTVDFEDVAVRPAFNLDPAAVLFTAAAKGGKPSDDFVSGEIISENFDLSTYTDNDGYKLTLRDENRSFSVTSANGQERDSEGVIEATANTGDRVYFKYENAEYNTKNEVDNEYISVFIVNENDEVLYYMKCAKPQSASGETFFKVPLALEQGSYSLKIFNEQINGDYKTDYASDFSEIALTIINNTAADNFGAFATDSGKYTNSGDQTVGVIRFLQEYSGEQPESYGFYFVDSVGNIIKQDETECKIEETEEAITGGFYGDLTDIPLGYSDTYYAKPFVTIDGRVYMGTTIPGTVNWDRAVDYPE